MVPQSMLQYHNQFEIFFFLSKFYYYYSDINLISEQSYVADDWSRNTPFAKLKGREKSASYSSFLT